MQDSLLNLKNQIPPCSHCNGREFFTRRKDFQVGAYCQRCQRWIKWISRDLARELGEDFHSQPIESPKPQPRLVFESSKPDSNFKPDLATRVERLEKLVEKTDRELFVHTRILGQGPGPRRAYDSFEREISDDMIADFNRAVGAEG
jgi:hypothetical protein